MKRWMSVACVLALLCASDPRAQERERTPPSALGVDLAIDRLPLAVQEWVWNGQEWVMPSPVAHLSEHLASGGTLTDEQWKRALLNSRAIRVRERWPTEMPIAVCVEMPAWLSNTQIRLYREGTPQPVASASSLSGGCGNCSASARLRWRYQEVGLLELGQHALNLGVVVERLDPRRSWRSAGILWNGMLEFPVQIVPRMEDVLPGAHDAALDAAIRKAISAGLRENELWFSGDLDDTPELANTAVSLDLTLLDGTVAHESKTLLILKRPGGWTPAVHWQLPEGDLSGWSVRVRGHPKDALHEWDATRYWDGELTIPLSEIEHR